MTFSLPCLPYITLPPTKATSNRSLCFHNHHTKPSRYHYIIITPPRIFFRRHTKATQRHTISHHNTISHHTTLSHPITSHYIAPHYTIPYNPSHKLHQTKQNFNTTPQPLHQINHTTTTTPQPLHQINHTTTTTPQPLHHNHHTTTTTPKP